MHNTLTVKKRQPKVKRVYPLSLLISVQKLARHRQQQLATMSSTESSSSSSSSSLKVLFIPVDHWGHINPCIGMAEALLALGHRPFIALEQSWRGRITSIVPGLEEALYVDPTRAADRNSAKANEHWLENLRSRTASFPLEGIEKLRAVCANRQYNSSRLYILLNVNEELRRIIGELEPDVILVDCFSTVPAVYHSKVRWIRVFSGGPLRFLPDSDELLPPPASGLPTKGDKIEWKEYRELELALLQETLQEFHEKMSREYDVPVPNADNLLQTAHYSPYLNIYAYPDELDYLDIRPLPPTFKAFPHFIRLSEKAEEDEFSIPEEFLSQKLGKLVYVSMGSMGSVCRILMSRLVEMLSRSANRFIFSLGPSYDHLTGKEAGPLPANIWAAKFVPQIEVLQLVDLVVTHGGNNTLLESLYFGKPMIVCPLFAEQPENAQRLEEAGLGLRINAYTCEPEEMLSKIEQLLGDEALKEKLEIISQKMQASQSTQQVAQAIVKVAKSEL